MVEIVADVAGIVVIVILVHLVAQDPVCDQHPVGAELLRETGEEGFELLSAGVACIEADDSCFGELTAVSSLRLYQARAGRYILPIVISRQIEYSGHQDACILKPLQAVLRPYDAPVAELIGDTLIGVPVAAPEERLDRKVDRDIAALKVLRNFSLVGRHFQALLRSSRRRRERRRIGRRRLRIRDVERVADDLVDAVLFDGHVELLLEERCGRSAVQAGRDRDIRGERRACDRAFSGNRAHVGLDREQVGFSVIRGLRRPGGFDGHRVVIGRGDLGVRDLHRGEVPFLGCRAVVHENLDVGVVVHGRIRDIDVHARILLAADGRGAIGIFHDMPDLGIRAVPLIEADILVVFGHAALDIHNQAVRCDETDIVAVLHPVHMDRLDLKLLGIREREVAGDQFPAGFCEDAVGVSCIFNPYRDVGRIQLLRLRHMKLLVCEALSRVEVEVSPLEGPVSLNCQRQVAPQPGMQRIGAVRILDNAPLLRVRPVRRVELNVGAGLFGGSRNVQGLAGRLVLQGVEAVVRLLDDKFLVIIAGFRLRHLKVGVAGAVSRRSRRHPLG